MRTRHLALAAVTLFAGACGTDPDLAAASGALEAFQAALRRGDREACRELLTQESRAAVAELPWDTLRARGPLVVHGAERSAGEFLVEVEDPDDGGRRSHFVVVREYGRLVVDLVATAGRHTEVVGPAEASAGPGQFEPRELSPRDLDRIRLHELSQPPR